MTQLCNAMLLGTSVSEDPTKFISTWKTDNTGVSSSTQIKLPLESSGTYNFVVEWGDGSQNTITTWNQAETTHTYSGAGTYTIKIKGTCYGWRFNVGGDREKILDVSQWGELRLGNNNGYFFGCVNLDISATDILDLTDTTTMDSAFTICIALTDIPNIGMWDTSLVRSWTSAFNFCQSFIGTGVEDINMTLVTSIASMLKDCILFNRPIGRWDTSSLQGASNALNGATSFDQDLNNWNVEMIGSGTSLLNFLLGVTLSTANYDALLISWAGQMVQSSVNFNAGNSKYSSAAAASRLILTGTYSWTVLDGGLV